MLSDLSINLTLILNISTFAYSSWYLAVFISGATQLGGSTPDHCSDYIIRDSGTEAPRHQKRGSPSFDLAPAFSPCLIADPALDDMEAG